MSNYSTDMFLDTFLGTDEGKRITKFSKASCSYEVLYKYWRNSLFERVMRLFIWENTDEVEPKEIEMRLTLQGHCGITKLDGKLTAMFGSFYGVTKYQDEYKNYMVRCPIYSGSRTIGKDIIVINNNALRNATYNLIHHYAVLLGHNETTLINALINARDSGGVPVASTEKQKKSISEYQAKVFNGQYGIVTDIGNLGIQYLGTDKRTGQNIIDIIEVREKLIKSFYSDIGVRSAFEKRNNTVAAEVEADTSLLLLNLSDMLKCREKACDEINKMFGTNWKVHIAEEIDYGAENQRVQFDTNTEIHIPNEDLKTGGKENVNAK
jgi:hypothetical protein